MTSQRIDRAAQNREELNALWATQTVLRQLPSQRAKGLYLVNYLADHPYLAKYLYAIYDPRRWWSLRSWHVPRTCLDAAEAVPLDRPLLRLLADDLNKTPYPDDLYKWAGYLRSLPKELQPIANCVLNRDLRAGLQPKTVAQVLARLDQEVIDWQGMEFWAFYFQRDQRYASCRLDYSDDAGDLVQQSVGLVTADAYVVIGWLAGLGVRLRDIPWQVAVDAGLMDAPGRPLPAWQRFSFPEVDEIPF